MPGPIHSIHEVQSATGVEPRTLRHWIKQGLIPKPLGRGPAARYTDEHVLRIRAVCHLRTQIRSLRAIRARLASLTPEQLASLVPPPPRPTTPEGVPLPPPTPDYPYRAYQYVALMPGLGLLVAEDGGELLHRIAGEIHRHYAMPASASSALR